MPHVHKYIDFVSVAYIVHNDKVLLADHITYDTWLPIGGHIELQEDPQQALFREVREECGLEIEVLGMHLPAIPGDTTKPLYTPQHLNIHDVTEKHKHVVFVYFARSKSMKVVLAQGEHRALKWFTWQELDDAAYKIKPFIVIYSKEAITQARKEI